MLLTRPPLTDPKANPFDLHVLSLPPAFALSQDQTLRLSWFDDPKANTVETVSGV